MCFYDETLSLKSEYLHFYCEKTYTAKLATAVIFCVCRSVALNTLTLLCNHHHHPSPELFHLPTLKLCVRQTAPPPAPGNRRHPNFSL